MSEVKSEPVAVAEETNNPVTPNEKLSHNSTAIGTTVDPNLLDSLETPHHIQQVVREAILLAGGAAAILLQIANPGVAKGVDEHSNFAYRPLDRLRTTMTFIYCMAFGSRDEKKTVIEMVHRAHAPVNGPGYNANDPTLQLWVAATLYAVGTDLYQQVFGPMNEETAEQLYREYAILAVSLRVLPEMWPPSRKAFWEYWDYQIANLEISQHAKNVASDLLYSKHAPFRVRVVLPLVRVTTTEMLPVRLREAYGLRSTAIRRGVNRVTVEVTKATYPFLPKFIRTYPMQYYLKDMRRRIKKRQKLEIDMSEK
ncbi:uncharacterized protein N7515_002188 [Penicillium bovifimosum]|uniref:ER-bound oxygenase mpaB/mpaB'/Rubber oxygenase catalytic domain-containing protein n=1 Tax=Penicillium bovifimosum TaxID=126998 RepID=A0A9W9L950_9EURO|nr:uncharacterized protein N7515_002188 [Penicillium bovifimosum]KAJ5143401.1 hypothetical protein N7515_002188 [Penicillium bovifimosum]